MERRTRRTGDRDLALQLFIASQQRKLDVRALTVSDARGRILAGSGEIDEGRHEECLATWELVAGGEPLVLSSWGGRLSYEVGCGVRRILESQLSPSGTA